MGYRPSRRVPRTPSSRSLSTRPWLATLTAYAARTLADPTEMSSAITHSCSPTAGAFRHQKRNPLHTPSTLGASFAHVRHRARLQGRPFRDRPSHGGARRV